MRDRSPLARNVCRKIAMIQNDLAMIQPGWFHVVGCKRDVPKEACYVGKSGNCYVWVGPEGRDQLIMRLRKRASLVTVRSTIVRARSCGMVCAYFAPAGERMGIR
jgi:hypothetical protein